MDLRKLNFLTVKDSYALPRPQDNLMLFTVASGVMVARMGPEPVTFTLSA